MRVEKAIRPFERLAIRARRLDTSVIVLDTIRHGNLTLRVSPVLVFEPALDETKQFLCIVNSKLHVDVYAATRKGLLTALHEQMAMLWREYALALDDDLDAPAQRLKQALLKIFSDASREQDDAPNDVA